MIPKLLVVGGGVGMGRWSESGPRSRMHYLCDCGHRFRAAAVWDTEEVLGRVKCPACSGLCGLAHYSAPLARGGARAKQSGPVGAGTIGSSGQPDGEPAALETIESPVLARPFAAPVDLADGGTDDETFTRGRPATLGQNATCGPQQTAGAVGEKEAGQGMQKVPAASPRATCAADLELKRGVTANPGRVCAIDGTGGLDHARTVALLDVLDAAANVVWAGRGGAGLGLSESVRTLGHRLDVLR